MEITVKKRALSMSDFDAFTSSVILNLLLKLSLATYFAPDFSNFSVLRF